MIELKGIAWNHTRGYLPMVATAQRFSELHPDVNIRWEKRSLQEFADFGLEQLVGRFDLLVIDHPSVGMACENMLLTPLDEYLPKEFLDEQAANTVGTSHESYQFGGHQWALAIDAATPVSGWRPDLMTKPGASVPATWNDLLALARQGLVAIPGIPIDSLMHLYMVCVGLGESPFSDSGKFISGPVGERALEMLRELAGELSPQCANRNPIATWELLTTSNKVAFCPFAYGYSNYSRPGYAKHALEVGGLVRIDDHQRCRSTLGGAGLAISSRCRNLNAAVDYCRFVAASECQSGLYFQSGGQPGHRKAWLSEETNRASHNFFRNTLATLDEAWLRPRWNGYLGFQDEASLIVHRYIWGHDKNRHVIATLNELAERSIQTSMSESRQ